ncbi:DUF6153 family protein [Cryobacterium zongtaii]|uniref:DUF6153 family protein n=1 Tax=Cryobacterium zongtaii TaxID=1259217 RepID=UPI003C2E3B53
MPRGYPGFSSSVPSREVAVLTTKQNLSVLVPQSAVWRAYATTFALAVALIGGLLAMHTISVDHGMGAPMQSMSQDVHPPGEAAVGRDGDSTSKSSAGFITMLACVLALLSITALLATVAPAMNRPLTPPGANTIVRSSSPGWSFSLPPPSLIILSISRV